MNQEQNQSNNQSIIPVRVLRPLYVVDSTQAPQKYQMGNMILENGAVDAPNPLESRLLFPQFYEHENKEWQMDQLKEQYEVTKAGLIIPDEDTTVSLASLGDYKPAENTGLIDKLGQPIMKTQAGSYEASTAMGWDPTAVDAHAPFVSNYEQAVNLVHLMQETYREAVKDLDPEAMLRYTSELIESTAKLGYSLATSRAAIKALAATMAFTSMGVVLIGCGGSGSTEHRINGWDGTIQYASMRGGLTDIDNVALKRSQDGFINLTSVDPTIPLTPGNLVHAYFCTAVAGSQPSTLPTSNVHTTNVFAVPAQLDAHFPSPITASQGRVMYTTNSQFNDKMLGWINQPGLYTINARAETRHPIRHDPPTWQTDTSNIATEYARAFGTFIIPSVRDIVERQAVSGQIGPLRKIGDTDLDLILLGDISDKSAAFQTDANIVRNEPGLVLYYAMLNSVGSILGVNSVGAESSVLMTTSPVNPHTGQPQDLYLLRVGGWADKGVSLSPSMASTSPSLVNTSALIDIMVSQGAWEALDRLARGE